jgi:hypothetical protein
LPPVARRDGLTHVYDHPKEGQSDLIAISENRAT